MITSKEVAKQADISMSGLVYRLKQMELAGCKIEERYKRGKVGAIRVYTDADLQTIVNWKGKKPGRKRKV
jgi:hypothetical protein